MTPEPETLLVVEDNPLAGRLLAQCLRDSKYVVEVCQNGAEVLPRLQAQRFDLILLDILLPGEDGLKVLQHIRAQFDATTLPVIMTTGVDQSAMIVRALELGANDYVSKPYDFPVLRARVQTQLSIKRMVEQTQRLERNLARAYGLLKEDLRAAAKVQKTLLPRAMPRVRNTHFAWAFQPCDELAGDTLNVFTLGGDYVGLYLLDVSGHGVAAALLAVQVSRVLSLAREDSTLLVKQASARIRRPLVPVAEVAAALNRRFPFDVAAAQFFTLIYGILNSRTGEFRYVCAGHPGPAVVPRTEPPRVLTTPGLPIGLAEDAYQEQCLQLQPGDRLYLYSDGLTEAMNEAEEQFGPERLLAALVRQREGSLEESVSGVVTAVQQWQSRMRDDVSMLALEWLGTAPVKVRPRRVPISDAQ